MAYNRTYWLDHVTDKDGKVIQQGTPIDQYHLNKIEDGLATMSLELDGLLNKVMHDDYMSSEELHLVDLMQSGEKWPFNNRETTVELVHNRDNIDYRVDITVLEYSGGLLGDIRVIDRARNGFKLLHDGSATAVRVSVRIIGGMNDQQITE